MNTESKQKYRLKKDLFVVNKDEVDKYSFYTREELEKIVEPYQKAGTVFEWDREHSLMVGEGAEFSLDPGDPNPELWEEITPTPMTDLIRKHYDRLQFDLYLKHKPSGKWVGQNGLVEDKSDAVYFTSGPSGEDVAFLIKWNIEEADMGWMENEKAEDYEVVSELGEMG